MVMELLERESKRRERKRGEFLKEGFLAADAFVVLLHAIQSERAEGIFWNSLKAVWFFFRQLLGG